MFFSEITDGPQSRDSLIKKLTASAVEAAPNENYGPQPGNATMRKEHVYIRASKRIAVNVGSEIPRPQDCSIRSGVKPGVVCNPCGLIQTREVAVAKGDFQHCAINILTKPDLLKPISVSMDRHRRLEGLSGEMPKPRNRNATFPFPKGSRCSPLIPKVSPFKRFLSSSSADDRVRKTTRLSLAGGEIASSAVCPMTVHGTAGSLKRIRDEVLVHGTDGVLPSEHPNVKGYFNLGGQTSCDDDGDFKIDMNLVQALCE